MTGQALIVQGNGLRLPFRDGSIDTIITSPPYWALRAYQAGPGEIGSEPTPQQYLESLWAATAEMMRVLKPSGSMFVDLGDKYAGGGMGGHGGGRLNGYIGQGMAHQYARPKDAGVRDKSLMLLPERYRIGCVDRLGLIARAVIIWQKPNGLPESVTDRVRRSHEDWVHLVRQPRYYSALDEVREPHTMRPQRRPNGRPEDLTPRPGQPRQAWPTAQRDEVGIDGHPLGKLPGSVWGVPSEPLRLPEHLGVQHYAAFPSEWPRRLILGFSPPGICLECGQGRVPMVEREIPDYRDLPMNPSDQGRYDSTPVDGGLKSTGLRKPGWRNLPERSATILGYACSCTPYTDHPGSGGSSGIGMIARADNPGRYPGTGDNWGGKQHLSDRPKVGPWREYHLDGWQAPPTRPAVVLDPFSGVGTTVGVARQLGRIGIGVDLSHPYCRAAKWRVFDAEAFGKAQSRTWADRQGVLL